MDVATQDAIVANPVGRLQELCMWRGLCHPMYKFIKQEGPPQNRFFTVACTMGDASEEGVGMSKRVAKEKAANRMLSRLRQASKQLQPQPPPPQEEQNTNNDNDNDTSTLESGLVKMDLDLRGGTNLSLLQSVKVSTISPFDAVDFLEIIGNEQRFDVTFVEPEDSDSGGQSRCLVQLATSPIVVCRGTGSTFEEAKNEAAHVALDCLRGMTKR